MRIVAAASLAIGVLGLVPLPSGARPKPKPPALDAPRIVYSSDWGGQSEIYAVDPAGKSRAGQVTFGSPGFFNPIPSPDGARLLFSDAVFGCRGNRQSLFIARPDGSDRRRLAQSKPVCGLSIGAAWSPDSAWVVYEVDGLVRAVRPDGSGRRIVGRGSDPEWSSTGSLAYLARGSDKAPDRLVVVDPGGSRRVIAPSYHFAWSKDGKWIAYLFHAGDSLTISIARPDGSQKRRIATSKYLGAPFWSADGRFIGYWSEDGVTTLDLSNGKIEVLHGYSDLLGWSPAGHTLAVKGNNGGLSIVDPQTSASRLLTSDPVQYYGARWTPDGRSVVYFSHYDLKNVSLAGVVRTIVPGAGDYGGDISGAAWTRPPHGTRYKPAGQRSIATATSDQLVAPWTITALAADGQRVAYVSCGHVFAWTPATRAVEQVEEAASLVPACSLGDNYDAYQIYSVAITGGRVAYARVEGNMSQSFYLVASQADSTSEFAAGMGYAGDPLICGSGTCSGELVGAGGLLTYSSWKGAYVGGKTVITAQEINRVDGLTCPCTTLRTEPGLLVPLDADAGRIVAGGDNSTVILNSNGAQLLSVPVVPLAAALAGNDLVILRQGELLSFDAATGIQTHIWPLPDVTSGRECGSKYCRPIYADQPWKGPRLVLEDAAHGLVTYVLDGQIHLLRLADGQDQIVGTGRLARFMDAGLVYADGSRLHLVPFDQLPLH